MENIIKRKKYPSSKFGGGGVGGGCKTYFKNCVPQLKTSPVNSQVERLPQKVTILKSKKRQLVKVVF